MGKNNPVITDPFFNEELKLCNKVLFDHENASPAEIANNHSSILFLRRLLAIIYNGDTRVNGEKLDPRIISPWYLFHGRLVIDASDLGTNAPALFDYLIGNEDVAKKFKPTFFRYAQSDKKITVSSLANSKQQRLAEKKVNVFSALLRRIADILATRKWVQRIFPGIKPRNVTMPLPFTSDGKVTLSRSADDKFLIVNVSGTNLPSVSDPAYMSEFKYEQKFGYFPTATKTNWCSVKIDKICLENLKYFKDGIPKDDSRRAPLSSMSRQELALHSPDARETLFQEYAEQVVEIDGEDARVNFSKIPPLKPKPKSELLDLAKDGKKEIEKVVQETNNTVTFDEKGGHAKFGHTTVEYHGSKIEFSDISSTTDNLPEKAAVMAQFEMLLNRAKKRNKKTIIELNGSDAQKAFMLSIYNDNPQFQQWLKIIENKKSTLEFLPESTYNSEEQKEQNKVTIDIADFLVKIPDESSISKVAYDSEELIDEISTHIEKPKRNPLPKSVELKNITNQHDLNFISANDAYLERAVSFLEGVKLFIHYTFASDKNKQSYLLELCEYLYVRYKNELLDCSSVVEKQQFLDTFVDKIRIAIAKQLNRLQDLEAIHEELVLAEGLSEWEKGKKILATATDIKLTDPDTSKLDFAYTAVQLENPISGISYAIYKKEIQTIFEPDNQPNWFSALPEFAKEFLVSKFSDPNDASVCGDFKHVSSEYRFFPASLKRIPGVSNVSKHTIAIFDKNKNRIELDAHMCSSSVHSSNHNDDGANNTEQELNRFTQGNINTLFIADDLSVAFVEYGEQEKENAQDYLNKKFMTKWNITDHELSSITPSIKAPFLFVTVAASRDLQTKNKEEIQVIQQDLNITAKTIHELSKQTESIAFINGNHTFNDSISQSNFSKKKVSSSEIFQQFKAKEILQNRMNSVAYGKQILFLVKFITQRLATMNDPMAAMFNALTAGLENSMQFLGKEFYDETAFKQTLPSVDNGITTLNQMCPLESFDPNRKDMDGLWQIFHAYINQQDAYQLASDFKMLFAALRDYWEITNTNLVDKQEDHGTKLFQISLEMILVSKLGGKVHLSSALDEEQTSFVAAYKDAMLIYYNRYHKWPPYLSKDNANTKKERDLFETLVAEIVLSRYHQNSALENTSSLTKLNSLRTIMPAEIKAIIIKKIQLALLKNLFDGSQNGLLANAVSREAKISIYNHIFLQSFQDFKSKEQQYADKLSEQQMQVIINELSVCENIFDENNTPPVISYSQKTKQDLEQVIDEINISSLQQFTLLTKIVNHRVYELVEETLLKTEIADPKKMKELTSVIEAINNTILLPETTPEVIAHYLKKLGFSSFDKTQISNILDTNTRILMALVNHKKSPEVYERDLCNFYEHARRIDLRNVEDLQGARKIVQEAQQLSSAIYLKQFGIYRQQPSSDSNTSSYAPRSLPGPKN